MPFSPATYKAKEFSALKGLHAITDDQIEVHLKLYQGYVTRSNKLNETLASMANEGKGATQEYNELKRRAGWEHNGVILHELYFDNLVANPGKGEDSRFAQAISAQFGDFATWKTDFLNVGKMPGIGWAVTYYDPSRQVFDNYWIDRHDVGHPAGYRPIVVMDLWEHAWSAYLKPTDKAKYLEDFFANIDWGAIDSRI